MSYGYKEYNAIKNLFNRFNIVLSGQEYEKFMRELANILKI
jgi:hypothetical protein